MMLGASLATGLLAAAVTAAGGRNPVGALTDPARSPLVNSPIWISLGTVVNELAVIGTIVLWLWVLRPPRPAVFPLSRPSVLAVIGALLLVFGCAPFAELAGELVHRVLGNEVTSSRIVVNAARNASSADLVLLLFALGVLPAAAEEALFRGLLTSPFEKHFVLGLIVPSVLFGLFHLEPTQVAGTIVLGVAFAAARLCSGTLWPGVIAHFVYNSLVVITVRYSDSVAEHEIGATPILIGLVLGAGGVALLWRERREWSARRAGARPAMPSWWI
jgi:membrane protease YdiL (CAAX protease family)